MRVSMIIKIGIESLLLSIETKVGAKHNSATNFTRSSPGNF